MSSTPALFLVSVCACVWSEREEREGGDGSSRECPVALSTHRQCKGGAQTVRSSFEVLRGLKLNWPPRAHMLCSRNTSRTECTSRAVVLYSGVCGCGAVGRRGQRGAGRMSYRCCGCWAAAAALAARSLLKRGGCRWSSPRVVKSRVGM